MRPTCPEANPCKWLSSAEALALARNTGINNTSLVLAFELPASKKALFFVGDAQRGNWASWRDLVWHDGDRHVSTNDLLARAALYKVGHHGSHNATLNGSVDDEHANLGWMATGPAAHEFTAMITAVNDWARTANNPPWRHPLPSIKRAPMEKAQGWVLQTDTDIGPGQPPPNVRAPIWEAFCARCASGELYFDLTIEDAQRRIGESVGTRRTSGTSGTSGAWGRGAKSACSLWHGQPYLARFVFEVLWVRRLPMPRPRTRCEETSWR